jgi:hypothetical protein
VLGGAVALLIGCIGTIAVASATSGYARDTLAYDFRSLSSCVLVSLSFLGLSGVLAGLTLNTRSRRSEAAKSKDGGARAASETLITTYASDEPLMIEQRHEILERVIADYVSHGYQVTSHTDSSAQLVKKKEFSWLLALLLWILYLLIYLSKRDETVYLYVDEHGQVVVH